MIDFLCIGAQKAGTTWLVANLKSHPGVWTPPFTKELHYFDAVHLNTKKAPLLTKRYTKKGRKLVEKSPKLEKYFEKVIDPEFAFTDAWYEHIFSIAPKKKIKGECTPIYSALNIEGIEHVHRLMPNVRLIYMIRDPYERAMSSFRMAMDLRKASDGDALVNVLDKKSFISKGDYQTNIPRWEKVFDPSQILYIPFGSVKSQPDQVMRDVERHLNLPVFSEYPKLTEAVHRTKKKGKVISTEITDAVKRTVEPQYAFLSKRFGDEFVEATK